MRRVLLVALLGAAVVVLLSTAAGAIAKSTGFKTGTYKLKPPGYSVTLKHAKCGGKLAFCVALPRSPVIRCQGGASQTERVGNFATPVALSKAGTVTEHAPITGSHPIPGAPVPTGVSTFSIAFTKNGTAIGYVEVRLVTVFAGLSIPCAGKVKFTAKLG